MIKKLFKRKKEKRPNFTVQEPFQRRQEMVRFTPNSYTHLRGISRKQRINSSWLKLKLVPIKLLKHKITTTVLVLFTFIFIVYYSVGIFEIFRIREIELVNKDNLTEDEIDKIFNVTSYLKDMDLLKVSNKSIEEAIKSEVSDIGNIYVVKVLPGKIKIEVNFKIPLFVFLRLDSYEVYDSNYQLIQKSELEKVELTAFETDLLANKADFNASEVRLKYLESITDPVVASEFDWVKVPIEEKKKTLEDMQKELSAKVDQKNASNMEMLRQTYNIPIITLSEKVSDNYQMNNEKVIFTDKIIKAFSERKFKINTVNWQSNFTMRVSEEKGSAFLFLVNRPLQDQVEDLDALIWNSKIEPGRTYDLRSEVLSIF